MTKRDDVLALARGFQKSRIILTAAELDFFTILSTRSMTAAELAKELGLDTRATTRLLDALVVLGFLSKDNGHYRTTDEAAPLSSAHPETVRPMLLHMNHMWENWSHMTETVRRGENQKRIRASEQGGTTLENFIGAMHVVGRALSKQIVSDYDAGRFRCLLDIGGGSGTYTTAFLERYPALLAVLFDLPGAVELAQKRFEAEGFSDRARTVSGNFYQDDLPTGCDLALLSAVIHQNSVAQNLELFGKIHRALAPGGVILIRDHIMDEGRTHPPGGAIFALNMLVATDGGDTFTFAEVEKPLIEAGFQNVKLIRRGENMDCLIEAVKGE
jgi:SAM-dependent methyltransferase